MVILMPEVKCKFPPRFAIKLNKHVYMTKLLPMTRIQGTEFIKIKVIIRRYCYVHIR